MSAALQTGTGSVIRPENEVGKITKRYGEKEKGELLVNVYDVFPEKDTWKTEPLWVEIDSLAVPLFIGEYRSQGSRRAIILFDDFERQEEARMLVGLKLYSRKPSQPDAEDEMPVHEYVGFRLTDKKSGQKGVITEYYDYPNNPLVGVRFEGNEDEEETLVPVALIMEVNRRKKEIEAELPEGLLEM